MMQITSTHLGQRRKQANKNNCGHISTVGEFGMVSTRCEKESSMVSQIKFIAMERPFLTSCMWNAKCTISNDSVEELMCGLVSRKSFKITVSCRNPVTC